MILIFSFIFGWNKIQDYQINNQNTSTCISVIIAVRNESENILNILQDVRNQYYDNLKFEVILVNDNSVDDTQIVIENFIKDIKNFRLLNLTETKSGKKAALHEGIKIAKYQLIITTDADCRVGERWLFSIASFYEELKPKMIVSPVVICQTFKNFSFTNLQSIEFLSLISSSAGAIGINRAIMCNAANLAFEKEVYEEFENPLNEKIVSGDDIFLMHNVKRKYPDKVMFLKSKEAVVTTEAQKSYKEFINQRIRWTSKSKNYIDFDIIFASLTVFFANFVILLSLIIALFDLNYLLYFFIFFLLKSIPDYIFLKKTSKYFGLKNIDILFFPLQFFYIWYVIIIAILGFFPKFNWKGREYKKGNI